MSETFRATETLLIEREDAPSPLFVEVTVRYGGLPRAAVLAIETERAGSLVKRLEWGKASAEAHAEPAA